MKSVIKTDRLEIRSFNIKDVKSFYNNFSCDYDNTKYFSDINYDEKKTRGLIRGWVLESNNIQHIRWAIVLKNDVIGIVSIKQIRELKNTIEISFGIGKKFWGKRLGGEILNAVFDYSKEFLKAERVIAAIDSSNVNAIRMVKKVGMNFWRKVKEEKNEEKYFLLYEKKLK